MSGRLTKGQMYYGKNLKLRIEKARSPHSAVMNARESDILGENVPHGKDGEPK